ncbi:hypothetical protein [Thiohalocapsa sp. ML1]|uniref:hypothetical protein n=1 Tax=Thiohalocapsa sp. ML1 TaxID=1431688 RepID=UPI0012E3AA6F|nr:hypothetical protein [Thiohalocapsa sp. ML1]
MSNGIDDGDALAFAPPARPQATWRLDAPPAAPLAVTLPAERALRLRIEGPASARFATARLVLEGRELWRALEDPLWGSSRADGPLPAGSLPDGGRASTFLFLRPERIAQVRVYDSAAPAGDIIIAGGAAGVFTELGRITLGGTDGSATIAAEVPALRIAYPADASPRCEILSPSSARRISVAAVGGPPLQVLQATLTPDSRAETIDLAGALNQLWQADGDRGYAELDLVSVTDGNIELSLDARWQRLATGVAVLPGGAPAVDAKLRLDPFRAVQIGLPSLPTPGERNVQLALSGKLAALRLHRDAALLARPPAFSVAVDERREVAQPLRLACAGPPRPRRIGAIWLWLEQPPAAEVRLRVRLYAPDRERMPALDEAPNQARGGAVPVVAEATLTLPADAARYLRLDGGFAHRAEPSAPLDLPSDLAADWFFVGLLGSREPVALLHGGLPAAAAEAAGEDAGDQGEPASTEPPPAAPGRGGGAAAGAACWRNLAGGAAWQVRSFSRQGAALHIALETLLEAADFPAEHLLEIGTRPVPLPAAELTGLTVTLALTDSTDTLDIASDIAGELTVSATVTG